MAHVEEERAAKIRAWLAPKKTAVEFAAPSFNQAFAHQLSSSRTKVVRLGGVWAVRMKRFARLMLGVALSLLLLVAVARWLDLGWTPRYVTLVALGFAALLLLSTLGARPRNPIDTRLEFTASGYVIRLGRNGDPGAERVPLSAVCRVSLEGCWSRHVDAAGDMVVTRRESKADEDNLINEAKRFLESPSLLGNQQSYDLLMCDLELLEPEEIALVAELDDGREVIVATQRSDAPAERLLALAALMSAHAPNVERTIQMTPGSALSLPMDEHGDVRAPSLWTYTTRRDHSFAIAMLVTVLVTVMYWLLTQEPVIGGFENTPAWLRNVYEATPFLMLLPIPMAIFSCLVAPHRLGGGGGRKQEDRDHIAILFVWSAAAAAILAYVGLREVTFGVPLWLRVASGFVLVFFIMFRSFRRLLFRLLSKVDLGASWLYEKAGGTDVSQQRRENNVWQRAVGNLFMGLTAIGIFFLLVGLGKLSGYLMGMNPAGGGGKSAVPLYFDLIVISLILFWLPSGVRIGSSLSWVILPLFVVFIGWLVLGVGIPGMSQMSPVAITFYFSLNAIIARHLLSKSAAHPTHRREA